MVMAMVKRVRYSALDSHVLAVAKEGLVSDWTAYIGAVPGICHDIEYKMVLGNGSKLPYEIAKILFSDFDKDFEWRH